MKIKLLFQYAIAMILTLGIRVLAQTDSQSSIVKTNTFSISQNDFKDETGDEYEYYTMRRALGDVIPEILSAKQDINGHWGGRRTGCNYH